MYFSAIDDTGASVKAIDEFSVKVPKSDEITSGSDTGAEAVKL